MSIETGRLTLAVQKTGRLSDETMALLDKCDISVPRSERKDAVYSPNFPLKVLFLRNGDIPSVVARGKADLGIVGSDKVVESGYPLLEVLPLGIGRCRLAFAVRDDVDYRSPGDFANELVATTFPNLTKRFFNFYRTPVEVFKLDGSVELAASEKWVRGIVDITSSGESMAVNGLLVKEILMNSEAEVVASPFLGKRADAKDLVEELFIRILATNRVRKSRYIAIDAPASKGKEISDLVPGAESPTITSCSDPNVLAIQTLVQTDGFWDTTRQIQTAGGREIVELAVVRSIPNPDDPELVSIMRKIYR